MTGFLHFAITRVTLLVHHARDRTYDWQNCLQTFFFFVLLMWKDRHRRKIRASDFSRRLSFVGCLHAPKRTWKKHCIRCNCSLATKQTRSDWVRCPVPTTFSLRLCSSITFRQQCTGTIFFFSKRRFLSVMFTLFFLFFFLSIRVVWRRIFDRCNPLL